MEHSSDENDILPVHPFLNGTYVDSKVMFVGDIICLAHEKLWVVEGIGKKRIILLLFKVYPEIGLSFDIAY